MTVICGGGPSELKPGIGTVTVMTAAAIEAVLTFVSEGTALLLAPIIAGGTYDFTTLCTTDPPTDPGLTSADLLAAVNQTNLDAMFAAWAKIRQWFLSWYWFTVCQCTSTTTPNSPSPSNPGNVVSTNPGLPSGTTTTPCWDVQTHWQTPTNAVYVDASNSVFPSSIHQAVSGAFVGQPTTAPVLPTGYNGVVIKITGDSLPSDTSHNYNVFFYPFKADGTPAQAAFGLEVFHNSSTLTFSTTNPFVAGVTACLCIINGNELHSVEIDVSFFCSGQSTTSVVTPCCPPDPTVDQRLQQILAILESLFLSTPAQLNSFAESTVHSGLSGSGNFATAASAIGAKVVVTLPGSVGVELGDPTEYFDVGWITTSAVEGNYKPRRIQHLTELLLFDPLVDAIHYTLSPGVTATITELVRGP